MLLPIIESLELVAYRGLRATKLERLAPVNLLVGPNNSGKTSILEAMAVFGQPLDLRQWLLVIRQRDPGRIAESRIVSLRWCFPQFRLVGTPDDENEEHLFRGEAEIRGNGTFSAKQLNVTYSELLGEADATLESAHHRPQPPGFQAYTPQFRRGAELTAHVRMAPDDRLDSETVTIWENEPIRITRGPRPPRMPVQFVTASSYHAGRQLVQLIHAIRSKSHAEVAIEVLRRFDAHVEDIEISSASGLRPTIYLRHKRLGFAPLSAFGDGMRRAVYLIASLVAAEGGMLLLDEIETGIHVSALGDVVDVIVTAAQQFHVQVVVATHSLDVIDAFVQAKIDRDRIAAYRLPPQDSGRPVARFTGADLYRLRHDSGLEVR